MSWTLMHGIWSWAQYSASSLSSVISVRPFFPERNLTISGSLILTLESSLPRILLCTVSQSIPFAFSSFARPLRWASVMYFFFIGGPSLVSADKPDERLDRYGWLLLLLCLRPVVEEPLQADVSQGMLDHLLHHLGRHRGDARPGASGLDDVQRVSDAPDENLGLHLVVAEDLHEVLDDVHPAMADVVQPPDERAHVRSTRLRGKKTLVRGEDERHVHRDTEPADGLHRPQPLRDDGDLDDDVGGELRELLRLLHHRFVICCDYLDADRPLHLLADLLDYLLELSRLLGDQGGVRRDTVEYPHLVELSD